LGFEVVQVQVYAHVGKRQWYRRIIIVSAEMTENGQKREEEKRTILRYIRAPLFVELQHKAASSELGPEPVELASVQL
jgi:hypothetical protein